MAMSPRTLDFPVFDADNHLYETTDAFTKYLPPEYAGLIQYVEVKGRTKIAVKGLISEYIPNPTFEVVAAPGAQEEYFKQRQSRGKVPAGDHGQADPVPSRVHGARAQAGAHGQTGLDRALMWPTLASLLEERLRDDPTATHAVVHALNEWMLEHWTFNYESRIFPTPVIHLGIVERAIEELEWVLERGAKIILIRPAPVPGFMGPRSMALPEFDPFWKLVVEAGIPVGMHASDSGYQRYMNEWEGLSRGEMTPFKGGSGFMAIIGHQGRPIVDTIASLIGHGLCSRFPSFGSPRWKWQQLGTPDPPGHGACLRLLPQVLR